MATSLSRGKVLAGGFQITRGLARYGPAQTIDMADGTLSLVINPDGSGTQVTSNILYVDPNSAGGTENLLLPPEADCDGVTFYIANTAGGAEDIVVKDDAGATTIATINQNEVGTFACDGTTWRGATLSSTAEQAFLSGVSAGTITASKAVIADSNGAVADADLLLESTNEINFTLGGVSVLALDDAAIAANTAATDTAGKDAYIETQDAGGTATAARTGGLFSLKSGDGSAGTAAVVAGAGGALTLSSGLGGGASGTAAGGAGGAVSLVGSAGGAHTGGGASGAGGAGGAYSLTAGDGGATSNVGADAGGAGGAYSITAGSGGNATAGTGDGGAGGNITLTAGSGGTSAGGNAGAPGKVSIGAGMFAFKRQTISVGDVDITLTLVPGTPAGTLMTGNLLRVTVTTGPHSLLLPPEADCDGMLVLINNTGGQTITVKNDAGGVIDTLLTTEFGIFFCDGTDWEGMNVA